MAYTITYIKTIHNKICNNCGKIAKNLKEIGIDDFEDIVSSKHRVFACNKCLGVKKSD